MEQELKKLANAVAICWKRAAVATDMAIKKSIQNDCRAYERRMLEIINEACSNYSAIV